MFHIIIYFDPLQVIVTTSKIHKLSQHIKNEKTVNERMKTSHSSELQQLSAEAKRSALEISKLKVGLLILSVYKA